MAVDEKIYKVGETDISLKSTLINVLANARAKQLTGYQEIIYKQLEQILAASESAADTLHLDTELLKESYTASALWDASSEMLDNKITDILLSAEENNGTITVDLNRYYTKNEIDAMIAVLNEAGQSDWNETDASSSSFIKNKPTKLSSFINDAGFLTKHQDLSSYATQTYVDEAIGGLNIDIDLSEYAKSKDISVTKLPEDVTIQQLFNLDLGLYYVPVELFFTTGQFVNGSKSISGLIQIEGAFKTEIGDTKIFTSFKEGEKGYLDKSGNLESSNIITESYTKKEVDELLKTVEIDLTGYATEDWTMGIIGNMNSIIQNNYATKDFVNSQGFLTEHQSLAGLATEEYVTQQITNVTTGGTVDLGIYATKIYVDDLINNIDLSTFDIPTKTSQLENDAKFISLNDIDTLGVNIQTFNGTIVELTQAKDGFYYIPSEMELTFSNAKELENDNDVTELKLSGLIHTISYENKVRENYPNLNDDEWANKWAEITANWPDDNTKWMLLSHAIVDYDLNNLNWVDYNGQLRAQSPLGDAYTMGQIDDALTDYLKKSEYEAAAGALIQKINETEHVVPIEVTTFSELIALEPGFYDLQRFVEEETDEPYTYNQAYGLVQTISGRTSLKAIMPANFQEKYGISKDDYLIAKIDFYKECVNMVTEPEITQDALNSYNNYVPFEKTIYEIDEKVFTLQILPNTLEELSESQKTALKTLMAENGIKAEVKNSIEEYNTVSVISFLYNTRYYVALDGAITRSEPFSNQEMDALNSMLSDVEDKIQSVKDSLVDYVTFTALTEKKYLTTDDMPSFGYITSAALTTYATQSYVQAQIAQASLGGGGGEVSLDAYATKEYVDAIPHIVEYTGTALTGIDFTNFLQIIPYDKGFLYTLDVNKTMLSFNNGSENFYLNGMFYIYRYGLKSTNKHKTIIIDFSSATRYVLIEDDSSIETTVLGYTLIEQKSLSNCITLTELESKGYATETFVTDKISEISSSGSGVDIDLTDYATTTYVDGKISEVQLSIPTMPKSVSYFANDAGYLTETNLDQYATKAYVDNAIVNMSSGGSGSVNLDNYATLAYVDLKVPKKVSILENDAEYASENTVSTMISTALSTFAPTTDIEFESEYIDFSNFTF